MDNIFQLVKRAENNLIHGQPIKIGKYATHDHTEKISIIDAYINSQHISGKEDSLGREKPFFNIVLMAAYSWYKTTDLDRKHIRFTPTSSKQRLKALIATIKLRNWMRDTDFGSFLNEWGWKAVLYGSVVSKFIEKNGELIPSVISWDRLICDPVDFDNNIKVEKLYFTPAQLRQQPYDQDKIEEAIEKFGENRENIDNENIDIKNEYIGIYEVHGNLPLSLLTGREEDETEYRQQMHVIFIQDNKKDERKRIEINLYSGREAKDPYHITHLIKQEGRTLSIGVVESLFDSQWMVNHYAKQSQDQLDLASKLITQTSDPQFLGRNLLSNVETGSVLITKQDQPIGQVNTQSHDIPQILSNLDLWKGIGRDISGVHEAITGKQPPSGTPYRLQAMLGQEARGLFDIMRQNKGLYLKEMMRKYILPYFKKTLKDTDEIVAFLDGEELEQFDELSLPGRIQQELMARLSSNHIPTREELMMSVEQQNNQLGNLRVVKPSDSDKTWADYFKDLDMDAMEIEITGESRDKSAIMQSLSTLLQTIMPNPEALSDPNIKKIVNKIIDEIGPGVLSPLQLSEAPPTQGTTGGKTPAEALAGAGVGEVGASKE